MSEKIYCDVDKRHDFLLLFDVTDGNPNGDPDAGNLPRVDPETMQGLVTDVCLKRKVRNWIDAHFRDDERMKIYVQENEALNDMHKRAYKALDIKSTGTKQKRDEVDKVRTWMCENFFDIRSFGAVMTTNVNCGQVRGPLQLTFARSVHPITPLDLSITRIAITKPEDMEVVEADDGKSTGGKRTEMGRKAIVPYGLYRGHGFFSPSFAKQTGMKSADLQAFWDALQFMWDLDRSSSRGLMTCRGLYVFTHDNAYGRAPSHILFDLFSAAMKNGNEVPRSFDDYAITLDEDKLPDGITLTRLLG
jgi:CRISPR-associated protein Csd2